MKLLVLFMCLNINAQTQETVTIQDQYFEFVTGKNEPIDVELLYRSTDESNDITNEDLRKLIKIATQTAKIGLKSRRSFIPIQYDIKYKYNKKGKHRYSVNITYAATNSYGAEMEDIIMIEYNKKFRETFGSIMLRSN